ncbi:hypothetical protein [Carboxylicivirga sp. M1479]|uniref:hypothetical protein n=1 Tax=Carboxylicivirga sp. M1479 TaxID=2594476 RepID=UPI001178B227|nr:hypothetical protein [Carboxylicivirga sp. M1479]TRX70760.1 hypothetical protein FNN09_09720 [Carboxylicivirga sp. M1479]
MSSLQKSCEPKEMNEDLKQAYKTMKSDTKIPFWHFSGAFIIVFLISLLTISNKAEAQDELLYLESPLSGDVYEYENGPERFSTLKVVEVSEDSVYFLYNNYDFSQRAGIEEIDVDSCYSEDIYMMSRQELKDMYSSGTIYDINRN